MFSVLQCKRTGGTCIYTLASFPGLLELCLDLKIILEAALQLRIIERNQKCVWIVVTSYNKENVIPVTPEQAL